MLVVKVDGKALISNDEEGHVRCNGQVERVKRAFGSESTIVSHVQNQTEENDMSELTDDICQDTKGDTVE